MIKVKIRILTVHRKFFNTYAEVYRHKVWVVSSRTIPHKVFGKRDYIEIHGNILNVIEFAHRLGNNHVPIAVLQYIVTPYPKQQSISQ